ncbi:MAG: hydrogenase maturation nickel metallochaperone HypA [Bacteroidales bacterium]|nr:hydrogenase maturation nickel metallochaperone HypA [Bacteroidales bacterium]
MHEFSIAVNIVEIAEETAKLHHAEKISGIVLEIGEASGIVPEALEMAMQSAVKNTMLENAKITFIYIPAKAICNDCNKEFNPDNLIAVCPHCSSFNVTITSGKEMRVKSIEID